MAYPTKLPIEKHRIRYKGLFDFDGLYNLIVQWMKARRYWFHETSYKHKVPLPTGAEQEISFIGTKDVTEFYEHHITIDFHIWDMTEVEMEVKGVKKTLTNARMEIIISGALNVDQQKRFDQSTLWQNVRDFFLKYIIRQDVETIWYDELRYRIYKLHNTIKEYLDMQAKGNEYKHYLGDNV
ncbi:hypothetical protein GF361_02975 [Candidatus Woesearchaeota archaeon]|nr:hypothetical protein [Candidatus Woesearchaeota archaeon]